ncbi:hypothetical protein PRUPE_8G135200 [Prunus persica]|uniref:Uncharacterized protein n=1 Tax=Prunus persica TaxID=3760 RepID=A0A251N0J2_PRUPE|nr:hypothetical protein PRUPE_8G135200 [Prunus persica]
MKREPVRISSVQLFELILTFWSTRFLESGLIQLIDSSFQCPPLFATVYIEILSQSLGDYGLGPDPI